MFPTKAFENAVFHSQVCFNSLELWEILYECLENIMDVDRDYMYIDIQHTHKDTHLYQIPVKQQCCFSPFRHVHYSSLVLYLVPW